MTPHKKLKLYLDWKMWGVGVSLSHDSETGWHLQVVVGPVWFEATTR